MSPAPLAQRLQGLPLWARRLLRWALRLAYLGVLVAITGFAAYSSFNLFVRSGATAVPDLAGLSESEAEKALADQGLAFRRDTSSDDYDDEVPAGRVVVHAPGPRTLVKRGSAVSVALSLGPQVVMVPDLAGQNAQAAQVTLAAAGLSVGRVLSVASDRAEPGEVVDQHPRPGTGTAPNSMVDLLVCRFARGETYVMPDLVYRNYEEMRRFFEQRNFRLGSVKFEVYEGIPEGVILRQFPLAGHPLRRQDAISLVVSIQQERNPR